MTVDRILIAALAVAGVLYARSVDRRLGHLVDNALNVERNCENGDVALWRALDNCHAKTPSPVQENGSFQDPQP